MIDGPERQTSDTGTVDVDNPWPGLAAFREADRRFFQGRETVVNELSRMVLRARLTVLHGISGLGKTSVLLAGLFPRVRPEHVLPIYVRLSHAEGTPELVAQVREAIERAARVAAVEAPPAKGGETLWEFFHRKDACFWDARNRIVTPLLVFDQFEEIFTIGRASFERRARTERFVAELSDLVEGRPATQVRTRLEHDPEEALRFSMTDQPCKVLLSIRDDFLPDLAQLRSRMPTITDTMYRLQPMTTAEALRVVEVGGGGLVDHDVAEQIVGFVAAARADTGIDGSAAVVEPALLSVFCRELNHKRRAQGGEKITADLLEGSRTAIISDFYERTISEGGLSAAVRVFVEERLLTESGFRDSVSEEQALRAPGIAPSDIESLIARRLLRREDAGITGRSRLELTHDVLAQAVCASRNRRRDREQEQERRAAEERTRREAEKAAAQEQQQREYEAAQALAAKEREAAELAQALARQEQRAREAAERLAQLERRSRRRQLALLSVLLLGTGTLAWLAWTEARRTRIAEAAANRALSAADVDRVMRGEPFALAFLARAVRNDPESPLARALLFGHLSREVIQIAELPVGSPVARATFNATGTRVLTLSVADPVAALPRAGRLQNGTARLWDAQTATAVGTLGPEAHITAAVFSPDGAKVLTTSDDGLAQVWDAISAKAAGGPFRSPNGLVLQASFDPTGARVLTISEHGAAAVWDANSGNALPLIGPTGDISEGVTGAAFSPDGTRIIAVLTDGTARMIDTQTGRTVGAPLKEGGQNPSPIVSAEFDSKGDRVITLSLGESAEGGEPVVGRLWDARTGKRMPAALKHNGWITKVGFSSDGTRVVTASDDRTAQVWDAATGRPIGAPLSHAGPVLSAGFSPDGTRVLTASEDGTAQLWDARTSVESGAPLRHEKPVVSAAFSPDGAVVLTASLDATARLWDARTGSAVATRLRHDAGNRIERAAFSSDGRHVVTAGSLGQAPGGSPAPPAPRIDTERSAQGWGARVWDVATATPVGGELTHAAAITSIEFSTAGAPRIVTASEDHTAKLWRAPTGEPLGAVLNHDGAVSSAAFSRDATRVVTASADGTARIWDANTGQQVGDALRHPAAVDSAAFSLDGRHVVTGSKDGKARLWNATTGAVVGELEDGHPGPVKWVAFSPDGRRILTSSPASEVSGSVAYALLSSVESRRSIGRRLPHEAAESRPVFSADGSIVTTFTSTVALVWDVRREPELRGELRHQTAVRSAAFSGDGRLVTTTEGGTAHVWSARTRTEVGLPLHHDAPDGSRNAVHFAAFTRDGSRILTLAGDGTARVWDVPVGRPQDALLLADLAETVGGREVAEGTAVVHITDQARRLAALRQRAAQASAGEASAESFIHWLFADPTKRTISPLSGIAVSDYVSGLLKEEGGSGRDQAIRLFPGHPALATAVRDAPHRAATRPIR